MAKFLGLMKQPDGVEMSAFAFTWEEIEAIGDALRLAESYGSDPQLALHEALTAACDLKTADEAARTAPPLKTKVKL